MTFAWRPSSAMAPLANKALLISTCLLLATSHSRLAYLLVSKIRRRPGCPSVRYEGLGFRDFRPVAVRERAQRYELLIGLTRFFQVAGRLRRARLAKDAAEPVRLALQRVFVCLQGRRVLGFEQQVGEQLASGQHRRRRRRMLVHPGVEIGRLPRQLDRLFVVLVGMREHG